MSSPSLCQTRWTQWYFFKELSSPPTKALSLAFQSRQTSFLLSLWVAQVLWSWACSPSRKELATGLGCRCSCCYQQRKPLWHDCVPSTSLQELERWLKRLAMIHWWAPRWGESHLVIGIEGAGIRVEEALGWRRQTSCSQNTLSAPCWRIYEGELQGFVFGRLLK